MIHESENKNEIQQGIDFLYVFPDQQHYRIVATTYR